MEPLGVRVVTVMCGSADTPMFTKPSGKLNLPETSYYYNVQTAAYKERMDHRSKAMKVDVLAEKLVKEILGGAKGLVWRGALASLVRFITWALPGWLVDRLVNGERGVNLVKRR
jgi:1-acylglycerone phosphate reductase